jgi:F-type H+-transporting ATPase subunit c
MGVRAATIASAGAAVGIGNVLSSSIHSVAINPSLAKQSFGSKKRASPRKCPFLCRWG